MEKKNNKKQIITAIIICSICLLLGFFYYHIDRYTSGPVYVLLLVLLFPILPISIFAYLLKEAVCIVRDRRKRIMRSYIPFAICAITLIYLFFSPYRFSSEVLDNKGEIVLKACYEGTQNQSTLVFREDNTFELHATGAFFSNSWFNGTYKQSADTLFLNYSTEKPKRLGDTLLIKDEQLFTIRNQQVDTTRYFLPFYLGKCKGLN